MKMIKFKDYLREMVTAGSIGKYLMQAGINSKGLENPLTRQTLNAQLSKTTSHPFITPYIALGAIGRVLAYANIILPQYVFLNKEGGEKVFDVNQFGRMDGVNLDGSKVVNEFKEPYYVYFSYDMDEDGYYDVFAAIVNSEELGRLMAVPDEAAEDVNEEAINEISTKLAKSYEKGATKSIQKAYGSGDRKTIDKRAQGIYLARGKMAGVRQVDTTEEVEIEEGLTKSSNKYKKRMDLIKKGYKTAATDSESVENTRSLAVRNARDMMKKEELVGNQHKIDANKNGKVDPDDFKILRNLRKK